MIIPETPFTTADFSQNSGGIDFLGLRWVSLTIVGRELIPELNNVTQDMGIFCLGAWIPWKFQQLCGEKAQLYTERNYAAFREKIEVAISMTFKKEADLAHTHGFVRRQLGGTQKAGSPQALTFRAASRGAQNSLYAAANYGPALIALDLIASYKSQSADSKKRPPRIPVIRDDAGTTEVIEAVDRSLQTAPQYRTLVTLSPFEATWADIKSLGAVGFDPAVFRDRSFAALKRAFRDKLLPTKSDHPGFARTLTTRLLVATLRRKQGLSVWDVRNVWYTGRLEKGEVLQLKDNALEDQRRKWSCLMARQYQRYPLELFLWCFEQALAGGARSIDEVIQIWARRSPQLDELLQTSLKDLFNKRAGGLLRSDEDATSREWNAEIIDSDDARFEHVPEAKSDTAIENALDMLASWYWRMVARLADPKALELLKLGGSDRIAVDWFVGWLRERREFPIRSVLKDLFSDLVFAQHMRIALSRFDGKAQRLRFLLGDTGIERAVSVGKDFGNLRLPWMPDRLDSLVGLLCDCDVLEEVDGKLHLGTAANAVA